MNIISIVNKDYTGLIADIAELLNSGRINIGSITAEKIGGDAFVSLQTDQPAEALNALRNAGFKATGHGSVLVRVTDAPGYLAKIARKLADNKVDIIGVAMIEQDSGYNVLSITSDNDDDVKEILGDILVD